MTTKGEEVFVSSVWSSFGHRFMSTDTPNEETCLTCGATYVLVPDPDEPTRGEYRNAHGDDPMACSGRTDLVHGLERDCPGAHSGWGATCDPNEPCEHVTHTCDCVICN